MDLIQFITNQTVVWSVTFAAVSMLVFLFNLDNG